MFELVVKINKQNKIVYEKHYGRDQFGAVTGWVAAAHYFDDVLPTMLSREHAYDSYRIELYKGDEVILVVTNGFSKDQFTGNAMLTTDNKLRIPELPQVFQLIDAIVIACDAKYQFLKDATEVK